MTAIPKHWQEAKDVILKAKPYWAAFNASSYIRELSAGNIWVVHWLLQRHLSSGSRRAEGRQEVSHPATACPKEGAVLALDAMVISKSAPRPDLAWKFINFHARRPELGRSHQHDRFGQPQQGGTAVHQAGDQGRSRPSSRMSRAGQKLEMLKDLTPQQRRLMSRIWTEIKAK